MRIYTRIHQVYYVVVEINVVSGCAFTETINAAQVELGLLRHLTAKYCWSCVWAVDVNAIIMVRPSLAPGQDGIDFAILRRLYQNNPVYIPTTSFHKLTIHNSSLSAARRQC